VHDDPIPTLETQLKTLQETGTHADAAELVVRLTTEREKRERWAVRLSLSVYAER
jgi:ubiquitin carboxyl-terminal hydrolase L5